MYHACICSDNVCISYISSSLHSQLRDIYIRNVKIRTPCSMKDKTGLYMGVSKIGVPQKWMVYNGKNPIKMDDLGVPPFSETSIYPIANVSYRPAKTPRIAQSKRESPQLQQHIDHQRRERPGHVWIDRWGMEIETSQKFLTYQKWPYYGCFRKIVGVFSSKSSIYIHRVFHYKQNPFFRVLVPLFLETRIFKRRYIFPRPIFLGIQPFVFQGCTRYPPWKLTGFAPARKPSRKEMNLPTIHFFDASC